MLETNFRKLKLLNKKNLTGQVVEFEFEKPGDFIFSPGQFLQIRFITKDGAILRSYSICSAPNINVLQLCVKLVPDGVGSAFLNKLKIGDEVDISEPKGRFTSINIIGNKFFIATGVGIAPIISMLESEPTNSSRLALIFGVRYEADLFWLDRLKELKKKNNSFDYIVTVSRAGSSWGGQRGRVTEHLPIDLEGQYFVCGSLPVVKDVRHKLIANGVSTKSIHIEIF